MSPFRITVESASRAAVVRLAGDLDAAVVPELHRELEEVVGAGADNVVLDLSEVVYADSSALGLLVWLDHRLVPLGGRLVLAGANRDVSRVLELSGLVGVAPAIATSANVDAALEGLGLAEHPPEPLWRRDLTVPAVITGLSQVRDEVATRIAGLGFAESALFDIKVGLGEALANAVRHGTPSDGGADVSVAVIAYADRLVIEVSDSGSGFDGTPSASADVYAPSGRGIMFMRALLDRVEFEPSTSGGTLVRLTKHRRKES